MDSSGGGRRPGVVRLRLPRNAALMQSLAVPDPLFAGVGERPPEPPRQVPQERIALWIRLSCAEEPNLPLGYLGINGVAVSGQATRRDLMVGIGNGRPDQVIDLPDRDIDPAHLTLEVEEGGRWVSWQGVEVLFGRRSEERVYRLDAQAGQVQFGDGQHGRRLPEGARIRDRRVSPRGRHRGQSARRRAQGGERRERTQPCATSCPPPAGATVRPSPRPSGASPGSSPIATVPSPAGTSRPWPSPTRCARWAEPRSSRACSPGAPLHLRRGRARGGEPVRACPRASRSWAGTPKPTQGLLKDVFAHLIERVLVGTELYVLSPEFVPLAAGVRVVVRDPQTEGETLAAVREALTEYLWPLAPGGAEGLGWPMGGAVRGAELATRVARVPGVREVSRLILFRETGGTWTSLGEEAEVPLLDYQLPDLLGVSVVTAGEPGLPAGLAGAGTGSGGGTGPGTGRVVPAPVIPELC